MMAPFGKGDAPADVVNCQGWRDPARIRGLGTKRWEDVMKVLRPILLASVLVLGIAPVAADDLTGANQILCTAVQATVCTIDDCEMGSPWDWNIPQFIQIDLAKKTMSTTPASGENRSTPIKTLERANDTIYLQGMEAGRAFSFVIDEASGMVSVSVARRGATVAVFGACTPAVASAASAR
jgi:hypothetical protein